MENKPSTWHGMNWIRQNKRLAIYLRDGLSCLWCGAAVESGVVLTLDHLKCRSQGGSNNPENLVTACQRCNSARGNRSVAAFSRAVADYLNHGVTAESIIKTVRAAQRRKPRTAQANELIALRGSAAKVLANLQENAEP